MLPIPLFGGRGIGRFIYVIIALYGKSGKIEAMCAWKHRGEEETLKWLIGYHIYIVQI